MTKQILQIENTNTTDFKKEILDGFSEVLKDFANNLQSKENDVLLTREETAKLLSVSLVTLWDWTKKDILPAYRIGNKIRYKKSEVLNSMSKRNQF
ncbi:MAG TPA: helix-turn-helix domain-containing protein [Flavobacterium sp.]|nr:helix-turn-helix domain-containing protein [Flavobacterium sp.]HRZ75191.1 helix-turn-helix domain-containing protein [Flavobacterium sp.]